MSARPQLHGPIAVGALLVMWLANCTLTSDSYEPVEVNAPLHSGAAGAPAEVDGGAPPASEPSSVPASACTGVNDVSRCTLELLPGACATDSECESLSCREGRCQPATCDDGRLNQDEAGLDCGGSACAPCVVGSTCRAGSDCSSKICGGDGACAETRCDDGVVNGDEPVIDCGNTACGLCADGHVCSADAQCTSGSCEDKTCRPRPCEDRVKNGSETDTDCGGQEPACARCVAGATCARNADCASGRCDRGSCSSCGDGERNGTETGVDCGGRCGPCAAGDACRVDDDCQSSACQDGLCCGGTRGDCTRCARRLAQVLNCSSNGANGADQCNAFLDCLATHPDVCPVRYAPGCSDDPDGVCNNTAFGTNTGRGVALADAILGTAGCTFGEE